MNRNYHFTIFTYFLLMSIDIEKKNHHFVNEVKKVYLIFCKCKFIFYILNPKYICNNCKNGNLPSF